ncbi:Probable LRR receptor-like serine/threonine-protein kinase [Striga hermonthica]|uniref:non-specific serine/threonine protein kinase n=1 Tax=Striga hermonthica TaxID=68872 RepID=A0A9N7P2F5_STRHE|nr:Probable LRR receptor-like serine/threonine-protein kinase [Striga hermonthica]
METNLLFLLTVGLLLLHSQIRSSATTITNIETDKAALVALKSQLLQLNHSHILFKNWSNSAPVCSWAGVTCSSQPQRVVSLNISKMGLTGPLVPHLGNLTFLESLNLFANKFQGPVPSEFAQLTQLKEVDMGSNSLGGQIPHWLGSFTRLQVLYLDHNSFEGLIPPSLGHASNLEDLDVSMNSLQGEIPQEIGNLRNLKHLGLRGNELNGSIPFASFNFPEMESLDLTDNVLSGNLPADMCAGLPKLEVLYLTNNSLNGRIPPNVSECSRLRSVYLSFNKLSGFIPSEMGKLTMLEELYLGTNDLTGTIPEEIGNLTVLKQLGMSENKLTGSLPQVFNISSLQVLDVTWNKLSGILPADMCSHLRQLEEFYLNHNEVYGLIPTQIHECSALRSLELSFNKLHGTIPPNLGNLTLLETLTFSGNNLTGEIPKEVGHLNNLKGLYLSGNRLTGPIPESLLNISTLETLTLSKNQLTGNVPSNLGYQLPNLQLLEISENLLTSESWELSFITSLTNCRGLWKLVVNGNPLNGMLPASVGNFSTSLQYFGINTCNLRGGIPDTIGNLSSLTVLDPSVNQFEGLIPESLENLQSLQGLDLSSNKMSGPIPNAICRLGRLNQLYLYNNQFSGPIPDCIENITALGELRLDSNKLDSSVPSSLWNLRDLLKLNLSSNSFVGPLMPQMANLKAVTQIDLSLNRFSGVIPSGIEKLLTLSFLNLSYNDLQGNISESMSGMVSLVVLDLSHNNLSGIIPKSLDKLQQLKSFNVSSNGLDGEIPSDGPFKNFTFESFMFNKGLCGVPRYHVQPCQTRKVGGKNRRLLILLVSLGTSSVVLLVVILTCIWLARYRKKDEIRLLAGTQFWSKGTRSRISYNELLEATNGYSESNFLGSGGFGAVYKGTLENGKVVAVKVFNLELEGAFKSFEVECEVLRNLRHRNLCKVIDCCSSQDFKALMLEYKPRGSLDKWLYSHNNLLTINQRIEIMIDVACALEYLHHGYSVPVIHCDLKPSNILLDKNMTACLCDFGIAKLLGEGESVVQTMTLATLSYIAPEYGTGGFVSVRCDVYSYGIVLMEVFTRKRPNDEMFTENLNLRTFVKEYMPNGVLDIIDPNLLSPGDDGTTKKVECLSSILELGLNCSLESPQERMSIKDVVVALKRIKLQLLGD